jgi:hypothetical protein
MILPLFRARLLLAAVTLLGCQASAQTSSSSLVRDGSLTERLERMLERRLQAHCLTAASSETLHHVFDNGDLTRALGGLSLDGIGIHADRIDVEVHDEARRAQAIMLALHDIAGTRPDGRGGRFVFYIRRSAGAPSAAAATALLAAAQVIDGAIPDTAFAPCEGQYESRTTRVRYLASAAVQVMILAASILFGLLAIRRRNTDR